MFNFLMKKFKIDDIIIFITTFITGLLSYTYMYVNLPDNSDTFMYSMGYSHDGYYMLDLQCARWARALFVSVMDFLGYYNVAPFFNFIISTILICLSLVILFNIFEIDNLVHKILFSCIFITSPVLVENMSFYTYVVPTCISLVLATLSMYFIIKKFNYVLGGVLLCISIGIYQPLFFYATSIMLIYFLNQIINHKNFSLTDYIKRKYKMVLALIASLIVYMIVNRIVITAFNVSEDRFGNFINFENIKISFLKMYGAILVLPFRSYGGFNTTLLSKILFLVMYAYIFVKLILILKNNKLEKNITIILLLLIMPIAMNGFMIVGETVSIRTLFAEVLIFLLFILLTNVDIIKKITNITKNAGLVVISILCLFLFHYIYYANGYAYQAHLATESTKAWCIELVSSIKSKNYYSPDKKLAIIGDIKKLDMSDYYTYLDAEKFTTATMGFVSLVDWAFYDSIREYGAFNFKSASNEEINKIKNTDKFKNLKSYPNNSSIELFDDIIVVKISE